MSQSAKPLTNNYVMAELIINLWKKVNLGQVEKNFLGGLFHKL